MKKKPTKAEKIADGKNKPMARQIKPEVQQNGEVQPKNIQPKR